MPLQQGCCHVLSALLYPVVGIKQGLSGLCCSEHLDSEAIVEFVRALCQVATEELAPVQAPRVYSLTKIVEISEFNMNRIR